MPNKPLEQIVEEYRLEKNESIVTFAKNCNIAIGTLNRIRKGRTNLKLNTIRNLSQYLGMSVKDIVKSADIR